MVGLGRKSVRLSPYRPEWSEIFAEEAALLRSVFGDRLLRVEHVGSTAVEGMEAKPLIDMMAPPWRASKRPALMQSLEGLGYEHREDGGVRGRSFLAKGPRSRRTHHLSLTEIAGDHWRRSLAFRDYLRTYPEAAEEYRNLKRELARRFPEDRGSYTAGKDRFVAQVLESARAELPDA